MKENQKILISKNGPYCVYGGLPLEKEIATVGKEGEPEKWRKGEKYPKKEDYSLCRCGKSNSKPYCDGTHSRIGFDGTETAGKEKYLDKAETIHGQKIDLTDAQEFCSAARFCHLSGGTWGNTEKSGNAKAKKIAIQTACNCPSGRLVAWDKKGKPIEPKFKPSVSLIEDPQAGVSGPIRLKGNISLESENGTKYERRNRVTLCRCGNSRNKPFCDGSHIDSEFKDGDESVE